MQQLSLEPSINSPKLLLGPSNHNPICCCWGRPKIHPPKSQHTCKKRLWTIFWVQKSDLIFERGGNTKQLCNNTLRTEFSRVGVRYISSSVFFSSLPPSCKQHLKTTPPLWLPSFLSLSLSLSSWLNYDLLSVERGRGDDLSDSVFRFSLSRRADPK